MALPNGILFRPTALAGSMTVTDRQTDRQTDIQTDRQTDRQTHCVMITSVEIG